MAEQRNGFPAGDQEKDLPSDPFHSPFKTNPPPLGCIGDVPDEGPGFQAPSNSGSK